MNAEYSNLTNALYFSTDNKPIKSSLIIGDSIYKFPSDQDKTDLIQASHKATFGLNNTEVLDETYRKAFTINTEDFETTFDINNVMSSLHILFNINEDETLSIEKYKVNIYTIGGHFDKHKDTPRGSDYLGTLVVCLPNKFEGGNFYLQKNDENTAAFEWDKLSETHHQWVVFYSDTDHFIDQVKSGMRITVTYNIFKKKIDDNTENYKIFANLFGNFVDTYINKENFKIDDMKEEYSDCEESDEEEDYMTCWFALPTNHMYIKNIKKQSNLTYKNLKGVDKIIVDVLKIKGFETEIGYYVSDKYQNEFAVLKNFTNGNFELYDNSLISELRREYYYKNVCLINEENIKNELINTIPTYGNSPSIEYVYESAMIMVKFRKEKNQSDESYVDSDE